MSNRTIRDVLARISEASETSGESTAEVDLEEAVAQVKEGLPKIGKAMLALTSARLEAHGISELRPDSPSLRDTTFVATVHDTTTPHTEEYQDRRRAGLEYYEGCFAEGELDEADLPFLEELREYNAQPVEERRGGLLTASLRAGRLRGNEDGTVDMRLVEAGVGGEWSLADIHYGDAQIKKVKVESDVLTAIDGHWFDDLGPRVDILAEAVKIFEAAREEDIQITTPVTI